MRRIKSVSVTIPGVAGPYTTVSCTLTLMSNSIRISNDSAGRYPRLLTASGRAANDNRFADHVGMVQSIATSSAMNDNGLFELNFKDERYLPFEFAGAISSWFIQFPQPFAQFDYASISDFIIHLKYTSRDGGQGLQNLANENLQNKVTSLLTTTGFGLLQVFSAKRDFSTEWYRFINAKNGNNSQEMNFDIGDRFPYFTKTQGSTIQINQVDVIADTELSSFNLKLIDNHRQVSLLSLSQGNNGVNNFGELLNGSKAFGMNKPGTGAWAISYQDASITPLTNANIKDIVFVFYYSLQMDN